MGTLRIGSRRGWARSSRTSRPCWTRSRRNDLGRRESATARTPGNLVVALTSRRLWICTFYGGLVATPRDLVLAVPFEQIAAVSPRPPRGVRLDLADGSELAWDHLPKTAAQGARLVEHLRSLAGPDTVA